MKINLKELSQQETESTTTSKKMKLSDNATSMVFQIFSKNIYSNPIGSIVREITSNCFDSHVEAGVKTPVLIKKSVDKETGVIYISFIDYGTGISPERMENIYGTYFESSKRADNTQIGGFGIGGKTPLAYKRKTGHGEAEYDNSYEIITIYNGIKYTYLVYEGAETPEYSDPETTPTTEHNGTEIRVTVLERDLSSFAKEMVRQLYYFENIIFEGFDDEDYCYGNTLMNEYQIVRGKTFLYRGDEYSNQMHACLGRVAYPLDYNVLGLNSSDYNLSIAVRLEVGEIGVTASRETIDYSENTIKVLKRKLEEAKKEITELLVKQYSNIVTLEDYFMVKNNFGILNFANGMSINVGNLIKQKDIDFSNFRYQFMKMPNDKQLFRFFFEVKSYGKKPSRSRYSSKYEFEGGYDEMKRNGNLLYIEGEFLRKVVKQAWLKSEHELYHIISKRNLCEAFIRSEIAELFNVHMDTLVDTNGKPIAYIQSLIDMQEEYFDIVRAFAKDYDKIEVPEDFIANRKRKNGLSVDIRNTTIPVKFMGHYSKQRVKLDDLFNYNMPIFYGTQEDETKLQKIYDLYCALFDKHSPSYYDEYSHKFCSGYNSYSSRNSGTVKKNSIMFIVLATNNIKYMEYCKKAYKPEEFYTKLLYRKEAKVLTYFQTYDLVNAWNNVDSLYQSDDFKSINANWGKKIEEVNSFVKKLPQDTDNIGYLKDELKNFFNLDKIVMTAEQKRIAKMIKDIKGLEVNNQKTLEYIHVRESELSNNNTLVEILKKVMSF
jgi:hypothetical protein